MKMINQQVKDVKKNTTKGDAWKRESLRELGVERKAESQTSKNATIKCTNNKCKVKSITCKSGYKKDPRTMKCVRKSTGQSKPVSKGPKPEICSLGLLARPRCVVSSKTGLVSASRSTDCQLKGQSKSVVSHYTLIQGRCEPSGLGPKQKPCTKHLVPPRCVSDGRRIKISSDNDCVLENSNLYVNRRYIIQDGKCVNSTESKPPTKPPTKAPGKFPRWGPPM